MSEVARGLIDLGIERGDRVAILGHTRPEWTYANLGILASGAASVSIYQTNSPEECHYVLDHSESRAVFVEDAEQLAKIRAVETTLPALEHVIVIFDPDGDIGDAIALDELRAARTRSASRLSSTSDSASSPRGRLRVHLHLRHHRAAEGRDPHPRQLPLDVRLDARVAGSVADRRGLYLFLPLAHAFALLVQFVTVDVGGTLAYWEKDPQKIIPNLMEVKPTYFPSVPRIFEKIYTLAHERAPDPRGHGQGRPGGPRRCASCADAASTVPAELRAGVRRRPTRRCSRTSATCSAAGSGSA